MQKTGFYVSKREDQVGFRICFANGYGISVLFGGDSGSNPVSVKETESGTDYFCENAEIAVINKDDKIVPFKNDETVREFSLPEDLPQIFSWAMNR
tara:strand:- start:183 stop:470 length:288 start_codon:yes stop_codon:yes gene_type:complete